MPKMFSLSTMFFKKYFAHENMKKTASKVAEPAQIQPKSQFLFHKNLLPQDFKLQAEARVAIQEIKPFGVLQTKTCH